MTILIQYKIKDSSLDFLLQHVTKITQRSKSQMKTLNRSITSVVSRVL